MFIVLTWIDHIHHWHLILSLVWMTSRRVHLEYTILPLRRKQFKIRRNDSNDASTRDPRLSYTRKLTSNDDNANWCPWSMNPVLYIVHYTLNNCARDTTHPTRAPTNKEGEWELVTRFEWDTRHSNCLDWCSSFAFKGKRGDQATAIAEYTQNVPYSSVECLHWQYLTDTHFNWQEWWVKWCDCICLYVFMVSPNIATEMRVPNVNEDGSYDRSSIEIWSFPLSLSCSNIVHSKLKWKDAN